MSLVTTAVATPRVPLQARILFGQNQPHELAPDKTEKQSSPTLHEHRSLWPHMTAQLLQQNGKINKK